MRFLPIYLALLLAASTHAQTPCCTIIDLSKESGTFTLRDHKTGRINIFRPHALDGAELMVGDTIHAIFANKKVTEVKRVSRSYDLLDAPSGDSCCVVLQVDSIAENVSYKVTAKNKVTGANIYFNVPKELVASLVAGTVVYMQPTHGYALIPSSGKDSTEKILFGFPLLQESK